MGDAIMATPALRSLRTHFAADHITFLANTTVRQTLSPCPFTDGWLEPRTHNPFTLAKELKTRRFDMAVLLKNSFGSALAAALAAIPVRTGYARQARGPLLTEKLHPAKQSLLSWQPVPMIDYYLAIASWLGADTENRHLHLDIAPQDIEAVRTRFGNIINSSRPIVILVPGGAFGPSKCWLPDRYAELADLLAEQFNANIFLSVSPKPPEKDIALAIASAARCNPVNLAEAPLTLGQLKALFSFASLVISNDTGPRHIAIALNRKVITLFGPNNPICTDNDYPDEVKIVANVPCVPCEKPKCPKKRHLCMESITVDMVYQAAARFLQQEQ